MGWGSSLLSRRAFSSPGRLLRPLWPPCQRDRRRTGNPRSSHRHGDAGEHGQARHGNDPYPSSERGPLRTRSRPLADARGGNGAGRRRRRGVAAQGQGTGGCLHPLAQLGGRSAAREQLHLLAARVVQVHRRAAEGFHGLFDAGEALPRLLLEHPHDRRGDPGREVRAGLGDRRGRRVALRVQQADERLRLERRLPGQHLVGDDPQRVLVGGAGDVARRALLRAHVGGLDVAVNDAAAVGVPQRVADVVQDRLHERDGKRADFLNHGIQRPALDELHHKEEQVRALLHRVDRDDVRVAERGGGAGLPLEALGHPLAGEQRG